MANSATLPLREDHKKVLKKLLDMERLLKALDKTETAAPLRDIAAFFQGEFWVHFGKEEQALFPELEQFIPRQGGPIGMMLVEHDQLRQLNGEFQKGMAGYPGSPEAKGALLKYGNEFIQLLRVHIEKEDNILFMMAEGMLDPDRAEAVAVHYAEVERQMKAASPAP